LFYLAFDGRLYASSIQLSPTLKISAPAPLFTVSTEARAAMHTLAGFDVSQDGKQFLVPIITSQEQSSIIVMQNWESALQGNTGKLD
jgi:hypothetical protein